MVLIMGMKKRTYMDHASATPIDPRVRRAMEPFLALQFGNPSAIHKEGVLVRGAVESARANIATLLGVHADEIIFTGSATESANLAVFGAVTAWQKTHPGRTPHVVVSAIEHDAVLLPVRKLEESGVRVTRVSVLPSGIVNLSVIKGAIDTDTVLVSVMYANNEIGTVQPIQDIAKIIRKWKKDVRGVTRIGVPEGDERYPLFHTDATQAVNYCSMHIPRLGVDLLSMNAAKIYGPKGIGLLFVLRGTPIAPIIFGGGHEGGRRGGTENVPGIIGFAEALRITRAMMKKETARLTLLRDHAVSELKKIPGLLINGSESERLANNINFSLPHIDPSSTAGADYPSSRTEFATGHSGAGHELLALQLDAKGFAVATKSACNETDASASHVLLALRKAEPPAVPAHRGQAGGTNAPTSGIRLSFGRETVKKDINAFLDVLRRVTIEKK